MLSVIVPVYNAAKNLRRCLDSLLAQDVADYEVICVDDGSTDRSGEILREYENLHPDIIRLIVQENFGVSAARNKGLDAARGDIVAFCDADDYLILGAYNYLLNHFWNDDIDVLKFNSITLDHHALKTYKEAGDLYGEVLLRGEGKSLYQKIRPCFVWQNLYRKEFLDRHDLRFGSNNYAEDISFNLDVFMKNPQFVEVSTNIYRYTVSEGQMTKNRNKQRMRHAVNDILYLFWKMTTYAMRDEELRPVMSEYKEELMLSCMSRMLSADYDKKGWQRMRNLLRELAVLPLRTPGKYTAAINAIMKNYLVYAAVGSLYRGIFVPFVLPRLDTNMSD